MLKSCRTVMCIFPRRPPFPLHSEYSRAAIFKSARFANGCSRCPWKPPTHPPVVPALGGSSLRGVGSTRDSSPRPHLADLQSLTVSTGRPRRKSRSLRGIGLRALRQQPLPQTIGAPPCRQRCGVQGGRGPTDMLKRPGGQAQWA